MDAMDGMQLMANVWNRILTEINDVSKLLQTMTATITNEVDNLRNLLKRLEATREEFDDILLDAKKIASEHGFQCDFPEKD
jgi:hypothetical protein